MASGHVNRINRPNTWLHRPMLQNVKKALANTEPSTHGTKRTNGDVRCTFRSWEISGSDVKGRSFAIDPNGSGGSIVFRYPMLTKIRTNLNRQGLNLCSGCLQNNSE